MLGLRIPLERALQLFDDASQQQRAGRPVGDVRIADGLFASPYAFQEVVRVAVAAVEMHLVGAKRFAHEVWRVGHQRIAIHRNTASSADEASAAVTAHGFAGVGFAINDYAAGILVAGAVVLHEEIHRSRVVRIRRPLDDVVVVLAPVEFPNVEAVRTGIAIIRKPRRGS